MRVGFSAWLYLFKRVETNKLAAEYKGHKKQSSVAYKVLFVQFIIIITTICSLCIDPRWMHGHLLFLNHQKNRHKEITKNHRA